MGFEKAFAQNQASWDQRVAPHLDSDMYNMEVFKQGATSLKHPELGLVGDVDGKQLLHLQCHFGQDTLSFARMGAQVTGIDFSPKAIETAHVLRDELGLNAQFHCCNVLHTNQHVQDTFDVVFTSYGTITWLPNISEWADVVAARLKPGGRFVMVEFHPSMWMLDDDYTTLYYPYWSNDQQTYSESGTYADREAAIETTSHWWNHPISELMSVLLERGLQLKHMAEYDHSVYSCLPGMEEDRPGEFVLPSFGRKIPYMYSVVFEKPA